LNGKQLEANLKQLDENNSNLPAIRQGAMREMELEEEGEETQGRPRIASRMCRLQDVELRFQFDIIAESCESSSRHDHPRRTTIDEHNFIAKASLHLPVSLNLGNQQRRS
jgi:hypothetical protein